jgi:hypothetical protein
LEITDSFYFHWMRLGGVVCCAFFVSLSPDVLDSSTPEVVAEEELKLQQIKQAYSRRTVVVCATKKNRDGKMFLYLWFI